MSSPPQVPAASGDESPSTLKVFRFASLATADLVIDAVYEGGRAHSTASDPLSKLLPGVGNLGGFRAAGARGAERFVVLYSTGEDLDWPDQLNLNLGQFSYYGDNKKPGHELHDTKPGGNRLLRATFDALHAQPAARMNIPPFFVFTKRPTPASARSVQFRGLAVPGFPGFSATEDLIALWKTSEGLRFQNYRATFTILDVAVTSRLAQSTREGDRRRPLHRRYGRSGEPPESTCRSRRSRRRSSDPCRNRFPTRPERSRSWIACGSIFATGRSPSRRSQRRSTE